MAEVAKARISSTSIVPDGLHVILDGYKSTFNGIGSNPVDLNPSATQFYRLLPAEQDFETALLSFCNQKVEGVGAEIENRGDHELYLNHFQISL